MKLSTNQKYTITFFIIGNFIISLIYFNLHEDLKNIVNFFTIYGTFASLFGILLAYIQIQNLNQMSKQTKDAVDKSLVRINQVLSVSELSRANKIVQEIQTSIIHSKYEISLLRMKDLKQILIQIKYNVELNSYTNTKTYNQNITDISIDINNINDFILGNKKNVNFSKVSSNLENLATILSDFENKLKFEKNDI